jgi:hypothetical protein
VHVYNLPKPVLSSYLWVARDSNLRPSNFYTNICIPPSAITASLYFYNFSNYLTKYSSVYFF